MNYKQVYKKIIDWYTATEPRLHAGEYDNKIGFTNGFLVYFIPKELNPFDLEAFKQIDFHEVLKSTAVPYELKDTGYVREYKKDKLRVFEKHNGKKTYVNQKLLTHFKDCKYEQAGDYSPVFIYKYGELQGLAFPVMIKD